MTIKGQRIEIPISKTKLLLLLLGSLTFVALGLWFVIAPPTISSHYWGNSTKMIIVGYASIIFFGFCAFAFILKFPTKGSGLIIDDTGLDDNSSGVSGGQILWSDISNISIIEIHRQKIILLQVNNPQDYINRQTSKFKRKMMEMNYNMYGSPLSITSNGLKISFDELHKLLLDKFNSTRRS